MKPVFVQNNFTHFILHKDVLDFLIICFCGFSFQIFVCSLFEISSPCNWIQYVHFCIVVDYVLYFMYTKDKLFVPWMIWSTPYEEYFLAIVNTLIVYLNMYWFC